MATDTELRAALDGHLANMPGAPVIDWENVGLDQDQQTYLSQSILPSEGISVGRSVGGSDLLAGLYQVTVNVPKGQGKAVYVAEVERLKARFVRSSSLIEGTTRVIISKVWANSAITDDTHFRVPVSIRYRGI